MTDTKNTVSDERLVEMLRGLEGLDGGLSYQLPGDLRSILTELQSLRSQPEPAGVMVKALEWPNEIKRGQRVMSGHGLIQYTICHYGGDDPNGGTVYRWAAQNEGWHGPLFSYQDAIDAAQADYERRILSALDLSPAEGEPVAWQRRQKYPSIPGEHPQWEQCSWREATGHFERSSLHEYRPLYAAPSNPVISNKRWPTREEAAQAASVLLRCNGLDLDQWGGGDIMDDAPGDALKALAALSVKPQSDN